MLSATDPLPYRPRRIAVAGVSGSGKSTLARRISAALDLPYVEMDALHHGPGWTVQPTFEADVDALVAERHAGSPSGSTTTAGRCCRRAPT